jgi:hypothetical protein
VISRPVEQIEGTKTKMNILYMLINLSMSFPLFIVGGSFIWGHGSVQVYGSLVVAYSILSCVFLFLAWTNPNKSLIKFETGVILILMLLAWVFFLGLEVFEDKWIFTCGASIVFTLKWLTTVQIYRQRTKFLLAEAPEERVP